MSDFPPTADFFAPHVAASAYRPDAWVSSNADRPAADPPNNACGPVPPPANPPSLPDAGEHVYPLSDRINWRAKYEAAMALLEDRRAELDEFRAHHRRVVDHWVDLYTQERERNSPPF